MKNFLKPGEMITYVAPSGGILSGAGVVIGELFGVAATTAIEGAETEVCLKGVFTLPKATGTAISQGARVYWDVTPGNIVTAAESNFFAGFAYKAELSAATTIQVLLATRGDVANDVP